MSEHRSFVPIDFSLRDMPGFLVAYVIISAIAVVVGVTIEALPVFWGGTLCGMGIGLFVALFLLGERKKIDIASLPEPSTDVQKRCDDPTCKFPSRSFAEAVKAYCDDTGASLSDGTEVLKAYIEKQPSQHLDIDRDITNG